MGQVNNTLNGFLVIDKPTGWTSHDVVAKIRRVTRSSKVGHGGTLDPMATGVLPIAMGKGTKVLGYLQEADKAYRGVMRLGVTTDTYDITGRVVRECPTDGVTPARIREVFESFRGELMQVPPLYSAIKKDGVPLYKLARKGVDVEVQPRAIVIHGLEVTGIDLPLVSFEVSCSKGTYIRSLCHDIGEALGVGACLASLVRTQAGHFRIEDAVSMEETIRLAQEGRLREILIPVSAEMTGLCRVEVTEGGFGLVRQGSPLTRQSVQSVDGTFSEGDRVALVSRDGDLLAVARALVPYDRGVDDRLLQPERVFV